MMNASEKTAAPVVHAMVSFFGRALCGPATSITRYPESVTCPACRAAMERGEATGEIAHSLAR